MRRKVVSAADAAALVKDGDTITTSGFVGIGVPDELLAAIEARFLSQGHPRDLSLVFAAGQGDGKDRGLNRLGHDGLLKQVVGGHWGLIPKVARLAVDGRIKGWNLPQGCISQLYRDAAAGKPGMLSKVGLETFVDPRQGGGAVNDLSTEPQVELMEVGGEEVLYYPAPKLTVALLRGTTADEAGNVTMEREALLIDNLAQAMAVKNAGGVVIVQVERLARGRSLPAREVHIPGILVDAVVVADPANHMQTYKTSFSHAFTNRVRPPEGEIPAMELGPRKIIARRCAFELPVNGVINLGIGMPEGVAAVAAEEGLLNHVTLTAEPGSSVASRPRDWILARRWTLTRSSRKTPSSTSMTAAASTWPASASPRRTRPEMSTSHASVRASPGPAVSSTSARTPRRWSSQAPLPPRGCTFILATAG